MKKKTVTQRLPHHERRDLILKAALEVLSKQGYPKFTIRNVAKSSGIHFASLQYHFSSKDNLLAALIDYKLSEDALLFHETIGENGHHPKERFAAAIKLILKINRKPLIIGFFLQLWALSNHDKTAAKYLDKYYDAYLGWVIELVTLANPGITASSSKSRARIILSTLEGLVPTYTRTKNHQKSNQNFDNRFVEAVWLIASESE